MAKRVDPLLSVTGNFGRYGGAHNVRATAIGSTSRGPHHTLYFRGVIRATEDNKQALREKSDQKSEVTRRMNHGAEAYRDARGRTVLPRHPHTRRAPIVLREADGNPTNPGWHFMNRGGEMPPGPDGGAPGGGPPGGPPGGGPPPGPPPGGPPPGRMQETSSSRKNQEHNKRRRIKRLPRDGDLRQEDADAYARIGSPPPEAPAPPGAAPNEADLFGDDDEVQQERPLRDGTGVPASPATEEEEVFAQEALAEAALEEPLAFSPSPASPIPSQPGSPPAGIPAAGNEDINPLVGPDPTVPVVDDVEEFRALLPTLTVQELRKTIEPLAPGQEGADGMFTFMGKKISRALRDEIYEIVKQFQADKKARRQAESAASSSGVAAPAAASSSGVAAPADEVFAFRVRLAQINEREIQRTQQELRTAEELPNGMLRFRGKTISPATRKEFMRMAREELESRVTVYKGSGIVVRSDQIRR